MPKDLTALGISVTASILDAMKAINQNACEGVFVEDAHGKIQGAVTDGDIRRGLLRGLSFTSPVIEIMNREFSSVLEGTDRAGALDIMRARSIRLLPILDSEGRLKGVHLLRELIGTHVRKNVAVILAGGRGSRMGAVTDSCPKPMLKVANRPILERIVLHLVGSGIRKIYISVNYKADVIKDYFADGAAHGCKIGYLQETEPLGTAGPLSLLKEINGEPILIINGDLIVDFDIAGLLEFHSTTGGELSICGRQHQVQIPFGVITENEGLFLDIEEKPVKNFLVNAGIYVVNPTVLPKLESNTRTDMPELIQGLKAAGAKIGVYPLDTDWIDVGRHEDLSRAKGQHWESWT